MTPRDNRSRTGWVKMTPAEIKAFSDEARQAIKKKVDQIVARYMQPQMLSHRRGKPSFGDVYELYTKWRGYSLILMANGAAANWSTGPSKISKLHRAA